MKKQDEICPKVFSKSWWILLGNHNRLAYKKLIITIKIKT